MLTILWAFGSMLVLMLIISMLPLGYTKKGKMVVVLAGLLLALGGLAAVATFPLWQTLIMLLALSFFAAFFMDNRLAKVLYTVKTEASAEDELDDFEAPFTSNNQTEKDDLEFIDLAEVEIAATSLNTTNESINVNDLPLVQPTVSRSIDLSKDNPKQEILDDAELEVGYLADIESLLEDSPEELAELEELSVLNVETNEEDECEDLELFVVKDIPKNQLVEEVDLEDITEESTWLDELAEISVMDESDSKVNEEDDCEDVEQFIMKETSEEDEDCLEEITVDSGWLDELAELPVMEEVEKNDKDTDTLPEIPLDDFELEELFVDKEPAENQVGSSNEKKLIKELNLQK